MNVHTEPRKIQVVGFGRRLAAALIDGLILLVGTTLLAMVVGIFGVYLDIYSDGEPIPVAALVVISGLILSILYYVAAWSKSGQTIAKSVPSLCKVTRETRMFSGWPRPFFFSLQVLPSSVDLYTPAMKTPA